MHKYGYCLRARPVVAQKLLVRGQHFLSIEFKSNAGWLSIAGEVNSDELYQFVTLSTVVTSQTILWLK